MQNGDLRKSDVFRSAAPAMLFASFCEFVSLAVLAKAVAESNAVFFLIGGITAGLSGYVLVVVGRNAVRAIRSIEVAQSSYAYAPTDPAVAAMRVMRAIRSDRDVAFEDQDVARSYLRKVDRARLRIALFALLSLVWWVRPLVLALTTQHHRTAVGEVLDVGGPLVFLLLAAYSVVFSIRLRRWSRRHPLR